MRNRVDKLIEKLIPFIPEQFISCPLSEEGDFRCQVSTWYFIKENALKNEGELVIKLTRKGIDVSYARMYNTRNMEAYYIFNVYDTTDGLNDPHGVGLEALLEATVELHEFLAEMKKSDSADAKSLK